MSVEKRKPSEFKNKSIPFVVLQSDVIAHIKNADALAIWVYLCSKPKDWIVRKNDIFQQLGIGRKRYADAIKILTDIGLLRLVTIRSAKGTVIGTTYDVYNFSDLTEIDKSVSVGKSAEADKTVYLGKPTEIDRSASLAEVPTSAEVSPFNKDRDILQKKDLLQTPNNKRGNENEQTNLEFNEPEKQNLNPNLGTHEEQIEFVFNKPEPKRRFNIETFADNVAEVWDEIAIQSNIKSPGGRKSAASSTSRNNITKIIKLAKKSESKLDYKSLDAWRKYFTTLIAHTNNNPVVAPGRSFKWAVKEKTYEQLTNDDYLRWSSNKRMA